MLDSLTREGPEQGAVALVMLESLKANIDRKLKAIEEGRGKPEEKGDQQKYLADAEAKITAIKAAFPNAEKSNPGLWIVMPSDQSE